ncbi:MAG: response regulator transcription factor [Bacteroidota bacterium]
MAKPEGKTKMKIFIADDSPVVRARLLTMLSDFDQMEVVGQASTVQEAKNGIATTRPDVVILDVRMPGGTGIDVLHSLKKKHGLPVVIIFTNFPYDQYRSRCFEAGADYFFDKSTEFDQMLVVFEKLASRIGPGRSI